MQRSRTQDLSRPVAGTDGGTARKCEFHDSPGFGQPAACRHVRLNDSHMTAVHLIQEFPSSDTVLTHRERKRRQSRQLGVWFGSIDWERSFQEIDVQFFKGPANTGGRG